MAASTGRQIPPPSKTRHDPPASRPEASGLSGEISQTGGSSHPSIAIVGLLLEVAWEALEDARATLDKLTGSATGVFPGGFTLDDGQLQFSGVGKVPMFPLEEAAEAHRAHQGPSHHRQSRPDHMTGRRDQP